MRWFWNQRIRGPWYLRCFWKQRIRGPWYLPCFWNQRIRGPWYLRWFWKQRTRGPWYLRCFWKQRIRGPWYLRCFWNQRIRGPWYLRCFWNQPRKLLAMVLETANSGTMVGSSGCPRRTIRLYYKSRLSSHGSSACPRRTTFVLPKSTFQPRKLRVSPAYYTSVLQKSTSSHGSSACPRRTTFILQVDFPATEAPGVPGVLYISIFQPRKSPAYYVCNAKTLATRPRENPQRGYVCMSETQKHDGPRQRRNPQRGYVCMSKNAKTRWFWHRANAETRRGLSAPTEKSTKNDGFSTATRRLPAEGCPRTERNVKKRRF